MSETTVATLKRLELLNRVSKAAQQNGSRQLVVFVGGLNWSGPVWGYHTLIQTIASTLPTHDVVDFPYNSSVYSSADPETVARELEATIASLCQQEGYASVMLVGHSYGTVLIRSVVLDAHQASRQDVAHWYFKIDRLVLLAPTNRGYEPTSMVQSLSRSCAEYAQWLPGKMKVGRQSLSVLRGSDWLNNFRLRWINEFAQDDPPPYTVVILGKEDRIVGEDDAAEVYQYADSDRKIVPHVGHGHFTLILDQKKVERNAAKREAAAEGISRLRDAIREGLTQPKTPQVQERLAVRKLAQAPPVVFLVHGIRDFAEWQETLGAEIRRQDPSAVVIPVVYGYFTALQFLYRTSRMRAMRTFVDRYAQARAEYPDSTFHVAAHSNGTWVVAHAVWKNVAFRFQNVYLCGSVLPRVFPWRDLAQRITGNVRNDCANQDWPVGVLCSTLSWIPLWRDIGSGGVDGFVHAPTRFRAWAKLLSPKQAQPDAASQPPLRNNYFLSGDHGAALRTEHHEEIAQFLLKSNPMDLDSEKATSRLPIWSRIKYLTGFTVIAIILGIVSAWIPWLASFAGQKYQTEALLTLWTLWILVIVSRLIKV